MNDITSTKIASEAPSKWMPRVAAILAAGVLAGTFAFAVNVNKDAALRSETTATLNVACGNAQPAKFIDTAGIDSTRALGIIISHPEKLNDVCDILNRAMSDTMLRQDVMDNSTAVSRSTFDNPKIVVQTDNTELRALADSLGITRDLAASTVAQTYKNRATQPDLAAPAQAAPAAEASGPSF